MSGDAAADVSGPYAFSPDGLTCIDPRLDADQKEAVQNAASMKVQMQGTKHSLPDAFAKQSAGIAALLRLCPDAPSYALRVEKRHQVLQYVAEDKKEDFLRELPAVHEVRAIVEVGGSPPPLDAAAMEAEWAELKSLPKVILQRQLDQARTSAKVARFYYEGIVEAAKAHGIVAA